MDKIAVAAHMTDDINRSYISTDFIKAATFGYELAIKQAESIINRMDYGMYCRCEDCLQGSRDAVKEWKDLIK